MKNMIRNCTDIGLLSFDRPRGLSCKHATSFCRRGCYNKKLEAVFNKGRDWDIDIKRDEIWRSRDGVKEFCESLDSILHPKREKAKQICKDRFRFCSRGELFGDYEDLMKFSQIIATYPFIKFWVPTRAWRDPSLLDSLTRVRDGAFSNAKIMASIDPSNSYDEMAPMLHRRFSTLFFGDNDTHPLSRLDEEVGKITKCPKTWEGTKGNCATCNFCFGDNQVHVWLKKH